MINKIFNEDCLETMKRMPDEFIDLVVTSPPYDNLRRYKGYSFDFEKVARELFRVLKTGGVVVWVVGDQTKDGDESGTSFKQALFFKEVGFRLADTMIFRKGTNHGVGTSRGNYRHIFEYMFVLSKGKRSTANLIKDVKNIWAGEVRIHSERDKVTGRLKRRSEFTIQPYSIRDNIWTIHVGGGKTSKDAIAWLHPAVFPEDLARDHIISWSNQGDVVYDPFMGSGTVAKMAYLSGRDYIGSEISADYCTIIRRRLTIASQQVRLKVK